jgi:hypothetical protein
MADVSTESESVLQAHGRTFHGFMLGVKWFCSTLATLMTFLVISFCTSAGWGVALLAAIIVAAVAIFAMNHGLAHSTEEESLHPGRH